MVLSEIDYKEKISSYTYQDWMPLINIIDKLEKTTYFGRIDSPGKDANGIVQSPFSYYSPLLLQFIKTAYKIPIVISFDWMNWNEGWDIIKKKDFNFDKLDIPYKCKLITAVLRSDRFCEGALISAFDSGVMLKILKSIRRSLKNDDSKLPEELTNFIKHQRWINAKTYAKTWPHEYIVQEKVDENLFLQLADFIDRHGYADYFYNTKYVYVDYNGHTYWHIENIINRCLKEDTYSSREKADRLPNKKEN